MYQLVSKDTPLTIEQSQQVIDKLLNERPLRRVLLIPPDITRLHSRTGPITDYAYRRMTELKIDVDIIPALGSHAPMTEREFAQMFPSIPYDKMLIHDWRNDTITIGSVPSSLIHSVSEGQLNYSIPVEVNKILFDDYDLILSLGQVVPHEVVGLANYSKNIFVGLGGVQMIDKTHFLSAVYGIEKTLGVRDSAVRKVFDYAQDAFLGNVPIVYILTVVSDQGLAGVFASRDRDAFEAASELAQQLNIKYIDPVDTAVCYMSPHEYKTTWLANKAVYRTRCTIRDGGTLYVLAPGVHQFGEDQGIDQLIRKYGYVDSKTILDYAAHNPDLAASLSAAAHLIHGSADGRFNIVYCVHSISSEDIESVHYQYMHYDQAAKMFSDLHQGINHVNGQTILYTEHAALELWKLKPSQSI